MTERYSVKCVCELWYFKFAGVFFWVPEANLISTAGGSQCLPAPVRGCCWIQTFIFYILTFSGFKKIKKNEKVTLKWIWNYIIGSTKFHLGPGVAIQPEGMKRIF